MHQGSNQAERDKPLKPKRGRGRPGTGSLRLCVHGWAARIVMVVDGEKVRKMVRLGTTSKAVAKRKLARLLADPASSWEGLKLQASHAETYAELAARVAESRTTEGIVDARTESTRERRWVLPEIGHLPVAAITPEHIAGIYEAVRAAGRSQSSLRHVRAILRSRFEVAMSNGLASNPLDRVRIPKAKVDRRERAVLTDEELVRYLGWQHPQEHHRLAVLERQTMSVLARVFGGLRTGDLHSMRWDHFDTSNDGAFTWGIALRKKTARPQRIVVPEMLRPILRDWWERQGRQTSGLVFPALRGKRAGEGTKTGVSHAEALRRDLARCLGLETFNAAKAKWEPTEGRKKTDRERELLEDTEFTRPVDFHSWRRRFVQALADLGVNAQQAQKLAGHADLSAHERYLRTTSETLVIPIGALPAIDVKVPSVPKTWGRPQHSCAPRRIRTCDHWIRRRLRRVSRGWQRIARDRYRSSWDPWPSPRSSKKSSDSQAACYNLVTGCGGKSSLLNGGRSVGDQ